mmetsp:Transcript_25076/g.65400  ORF Transcript_25076/g.65400 Transcript_25076/m.65400 type:complete len:359 (+) Transcript_25076:250-1326(+)
MDAVFNWLREEAGVVEPDLDQLMLSFEANGITTMGLVAQMRLADWSAVTPKIGLRHKLAAAVADQRPKREAAESRAECARMATAVMDVKARSAKAQLFLEKLQDQEQNLDGSIAHQRSLLVAAEAEPARARFTALSQQVAGLRAANAVLDREIEEARAQLASAVAEKTAIINHAVDSERTSMALKSLDIPSLNSPPTRKKPKKSKAAKDKWADVSNAPWFVGDVDRAECIKRLLLPACSVGSFCVRNGSSDENPYALSFRGFGDGPSSVRHMRILRVPSTGKFKLAKRKPDMFEADSVGDLVGYYLNMDVGDGITLREAAPKPRLVPKSKGIQPHELEAQLLAAGAAPASAAATPSTS